LFTSLTLLGLAACGGPEKARLELTREVRYDSPVISRVSHELPGYQGPAAPSVAEVVIEGDPGLEATFDIPGVTTRQPMTESAEGGRYVGQVRFPASHGGSYTVTGRLSDPDAGEVTMDAPGRLVLPPAGWVPPVTEEAGCAGKKIEDLRQAVAGLRVPFRTNSSELGPTIPLLLERLVVYIPRFPECELRVDGHADQRGEAGYNQKLGLLRATSVITYLVEQGVAREQLRAKSFGFQSPLEKGDSPEALARNRRVEFTILEESR
jgi:outer membrane protein OmpA-like peptidoglycan-associated protein